MCDLLDVYKKTERLLTLDPDWSSCHVGRCKSTTNLSCCAEYNPGPSPPPQLKISAFADKQSNGSIDGTVDWVETEVPAAKEHIPVPLWDGSCCLYCDAPCSKCTWPFKRMWEDCFGPNTPVNNQRTRYNFFSPQALLCTKIMQHLTSKIDAPNALVPWALDNAL